MQNWNKTLSSDFMETNITPPDPNVDFPPDCAHLYPEDFRYPEGYFPSENRVTDLPILRNFGVIARPYLIWNKEGEAVIDPKAPTPVSLLLRKRDATLHSAIRYLEWSGSPDEALQATFDCEDKNDEANGYSEAGFHGVAIKMIRSQPEPFQQTSTALVALVRSLTAIGRHEEALLEIRRLIPTDDITDYARQLYRIEEANLLILCGKIAEAEAILDEQRNQCSDMYEYYGVRAAIALMKNDEALAKSLVLKAGRVNDYHSYKLLWNPLLASLRRFIRHELVGESGEPRLYRQNVDAKHLCHRIQGALLTGDRTHAANLMEALVLRQITDWPCAEEAVLCMVGFGYFRSLEPAAGMLPGCNHTALRFARTAAQCLLHPGSRTNEELCHLFEKLYPSSAAQKHFEELLPYFASGTPPKIPEFAELLLGEVGDTRRTAEGRELFQLLALPGGKFRIHGLFERTGSPKPSDPAFDPRDHLDTTRVIEFDSHFKLEEWLEEKLAENLPAVSNRFTCKQWDIQLNGWGFLQALCPDPRQTPLTSKAWELMRDDPNLYFTSGPALSFALKTSFADRFIQMLIQYLGRPQRVGDSFRDGDIGE